MTLPEQRAPRAFGILFATLITPLLSMLSFPVISWIFENSYQDPELVFAEGIDWSNLKNVEELWIFSGLTAVVVLFFLIHARRCVLNKLSGVTRALAAIATGIGFAASIINIIFIGEEMNWFEVSSLADDMFLTTLGILSALCSGAWAILTRRWAAYDVFRYGVRYVANAAMLALLIAIPSHVIDVEDGGFLSGIGTAIAGYFSLQVLLVCGVCELWRYRFEPRDPLRPAVLQDLPARIALRESVMLASAAFFLFVLSYAMYGFAYRERFTVALLGQIGFCVLGSCAAARGIAGYLMRESRPLWFLGMYLLLADLVVVVAWKLILPRVF